MCICVCVCVCVCVHVCGLSLATMQLTVLSDTPNICRCRRMRPGFAGHHVIQFPPISSSNTHSRMIMNNSTEAREEKRRERMMWHLRVVWVNSVSHVCTDHQRLGYCFLKRHRVATSSTDTPQNILLQRRVCTLSTCWAHLQAHTQTTH